MTDSELIFDLACKNSRSYNLHKTVEELNELATVCSQIANKPALINRYIENLYVELADVEIRLKILKKVYGKKLVNRHYRSKMNKYKKYVEEGKYKNI